MLGQTERRTYLNISGGKIVRRIGSGGMETFDYVEGDLERIYTKDREFRGEKVPYWYLDLKDTQTGELYSLGINASSGVWRSLIFALGSNENFLLPIRISPYKKGDYDRVSVYSGGERLDWVSGIPPVEEIELGGRKYKSVEKREAFISSLVDKINNDLGQTPRRVPRKGGSKLSLSALLEDI